MERENIKVFLLAARMETSQSISIESFSYSWLVNIKPSLESLETSPDASDEASYIVMDPRMPPSRRFFSNSQDFKFDFPTSESSHAAVHADELFSNGYLLPLYIDPLEMEAYSPLESTETLSASLHVPMTSKTRCPSFRTCRRLSKRIFLKYFDFLKPLCRRLRSHRSSSRNNKVEMEKILMHSAETSPRISAVYPTDDIRRSCDSESSIYEAVLHCKRSIGNSVS